jgi:hypothetical protein
VSIDLEGARCEEEAARLLPWYVAGSLPTADAERVAAHLEHCAICRDDFAHERRVRLLVKADPRVEYAPQTGLAKTLARIDELEREAPTAGFAHEAPLAAAARRGGAVPWLTAAVVVQTVGLALLGGALLQRAPAGPTAARYATLASSPPPVASGAHIRAVFAATTTLADLKQLLAPAQLTIVRGPSEAGAYTLASTDRQLTGNRLEQTIEALRRRPQVLFAEPAADEEAGAR